MKHLAVKMYEGCVCRVERILNFCARWKGVVTSTFWPLHPGENPLVHIMRPQSPTVEPVTLQENIFTLLERIFFVQRYIFSKSTNLHLIFVYSIGIIFKMSKSVQQLCLNPSTYGSFLLNNITIFAWTKYSVYPGLKYLSLRLPVDRWGFILIKILRMYFNIILSSSGITSNWRLFFSFRTKIIILFLLFSVILCVFSLIETPYLTEDYKLLTQGLEYQILRCVIPVVLVY